MYVMFLCECLKGSLFQRCLLSTCSFSFIPEFHPFLPSMTFFCFSIILAVWDACRSLFASISFLFSYNCVATCRRH